MRLVLGHLEPVPNPNREKALLLAWEKFHSLHPKEFLPKWVQEFIAVRVEEKAGRYVVSMDAFPQPPLPKENEYWDLGLRGKRVLCCVDPDTRQEREILAREKEPPIVVFQAAVDLASKEIEIVVDRIASMDEALYELPPWKINDNEVAAFSLAKFRSIHPLESLPEWFLDCLTIDGMGIRGRRYLLNLIVYPKLKLPENYFWEMSKDGFRSLVHLDPKTGKKGYLIADGPEYEPPIVVFQSSFDQMTKMVEVVLDTDISAMNESLYEPIHFNLRKSGWSRGIFDDPAFNQHSDIGINKR